VEHAEVVVPPYLVLTCGGELPELYEHYRKHATLLEEFDLASSEGRFCFFGVGRQLDWPDLVVAQRYHPAGYGFYPGILVVPETATVFIGAGERLLAYKLNTNPERLWIDQADVGFWSWSRFGEYVLMAAELELAAWSIHGKKLWSAFVEPSWSFSVSASTVELDVMGKKSTFDIATGPKAG
jgi:hypothetical protein